MVGAPFDGRVVGLNISAGAFAVGVILGGLRIGGGDFFIPRYDSLMGLLIVLGVGTAMAAWLSTGAKRNSYAGWQMALALFMTIVQDPHPVTELDVIWDRFVGIVLGVVSDAPCIRVSQHRISPGKFGARGRCRP
jgi:hypothetical protein